jgi:hypothetical protein
MALHFTCIVFCVSRKIITINRVHQLKLWRRCNFFCAVRNQLFTVYQVGRNSSVGIETRYGLDSPGTWSCWGEIFPHSSRPAPGAHSASCTMGIWSAVPGVRRLGRGADNPPPPNSEVKRKSRAVILLSLSLSLSLSLWDCMACSRVKYKVVQKLQVQVLPLTMISRLYHFSCCFPFLRTLVAFLLTTLS